MYTIKQASRITGITYAKLWYGGIVGKYPRPELKVGNRYYYSQDQLQEIIKRDEGMTRKESNEHRRQD